MVQTPKPKLTPVLVQWRGRSSHHVCFVCRKQFRKPVTLRTERSITGNLGSVRGFNRDQASYPCPQCGKTMTHMGKNFRAPKQSDAEGWEVARRLAAAGFIHAHDTGREYPSRLKDVEGFLRCHVPRSDGARLLEKWGRG